jgi:hypothetical protein
MIITFLVMLRAMSIIKMLTGLADFVMSAIFWMVIGVLSFFKAIIDVLINIVSLFEKLMPVPIFGAVVGGFIYLLKNNNNHQ